MFLIMILSSLLTTMNLWVDKLSDIRFSLNDIYMALVMTGWMFLFIGILYRDFGIVIIGSLLVLVNIWCIRNQFFINETQYKLGMIPHHSMAIHMSKKLLDRENNMERFLKNLIQTQEDEIEFMKQ